MTAPDSNDAADYATHDQWGLHSKFRKVLGQWQSEPSCDSADSWLYKQLSLIMARDRRVQAMVLRAVAETCRSNGQAHDNVGQHAEANRPWEAYHAVLVLADFIRQGTVTLSIE